MPCKAPPASTPAGRQSALLPASGAYAPIMTIPYRRGMAMSSDRPWLAQYSPGVPAEINPDEYASVVAVLDGAIAQFRDRPAFSSSSEERRVGKEGVSTCRSRGSPYH